METPSHPVLSSCSAATNSSVIRSMWTEDFFLFSVAVFFVPAKFLFELNQQAAILQNWLPEPIPCEPYLLIITSMTIWFLLRNFLFYTALSMLRIAKPESKSIIKKNLYSLYPSISVEFSPRLPQSIQILDYNSFGKVGPIQRVRSRIALLFFYRIYPTKVLEKGISRILFFNRLQNKQKRIGGLAVKSRNEIYVSTHGKTISRILKTLHHEFGHMCTKSENFAKTFNKEQWMSLHQNQSTLYPFDRAGGGLAAIQEGRAGNKPSSEALAFGFLHEYGSASFEEDFCSYVDLMFAKPNKLVELQVNKIVKRKTKIIYDYYVALGAKIPTEIHDLWR